MRPVAHIYMPLQVSSGQSKNHRLGIRERATPTETNGRATTKIPDRNLDTAQPLADSTFSIIKIKAEFTKNIYPCTIP